jgi:cell division protein FtsI/penicillin-binding protein 2
MLEHATQVIAPPGSTFKLVVAATDLVYPVIPAGEVIPTGGSFTLGNHTYNNWSVLGPMNLVPSIAWSNDVYFYKLAWALGPERIYQIGTALGVGQPTGIDLPGENAGYLGNPHSVGRIGGTWYAGSTVILGIGQGYVDVTPLQNARWTAALATGSLVTPHLGLAVGTEGGDFTALPVRAPAPLPFAAGLGPIREGMRQAVTYGTAALLSNLPVPAGAKTGSAEDPSNPNGVTDSWLTAAAPINNPAVVVTSLVRAGGHGATTSGPVVDQALQYFFAHQGPILATAPTP